MADNMNLTYTVDAETGGMLELSRGAEKAEKDVVKSFEKMDVAVDKFGNELNQTNIDMGRFIDKQNRMREANGQFVKGLEYTKDNLKGVGGGLSETAKGVNEATSSMKGLRGAIGNVGFQLQDIAVQAQMGTNAFVILGQQGSQIAGAFGPGGAVIGAFIAIGAAIAHVVSGLGDSSAALERFQEAMGSLSDEDLAALVGDKQALALDEYTNKLKNMNKEQGVTQGILDDMIAKYAEYDRQLAAIDTSTDRGKVQFAATSRAQQLLGIEITQTNKALSIQDDEAKKVARSVSILNGTTKILTESQQDAQDTINSTIKNLQTQAAVMGMSTKGAALYRLEQMGLNEEQRKAAIIALDIIQAEADKQAANRASTKSLQDKARAEREAAKAEADSKKASVGFVKGFGESIAGEDDSSFTGLSATAIETPKVTALRNERELLLELQNLEYGDALSHAERIKQIDDELVTYKKQSMGMMFSAASAGFDGMAGLVGSFAGEQSSAYKALFGISKAFAIADAAINMQMAISKAAAMGFPQNIPLIAQATAQGASIASTIGGIAFGGGRLNGGSVQAGKAYRVNENGKSEALMFGMGTKQYMMPNRNGKVVSSGDVGGGGVVNNITISISEAQGMDANQLSSLIDTKIMQSMQNQMRVGGMLAR